MSKAQNSHVCTCPSGDGSLRWPCPVHPPAAQEASEAVAIREAVTLLMNEAARLERVYGIRGWYGFSDEKAAHIEHLRVAEALASLPEPKAQLADALDAAVAALEFNEWIKCEYPHLGPIADGVHIAHEAWNAGRAALAAAQEGRDSTQKCVNV